LFGPKPKKRKRKKKREKGKKEKEKKRKRHYSESRPNDKGRIDDDQLKVATSGLLLFDVLPRRLRGVGFGVWGLGFRVYGVGCRV